MATQQEEQDSQPSDFELFGYSCQTLKDGSTQVTFHPKATLEKLLESAKYCDVIQCDYLDNEPSWMDIFNEASWSGVKIGYLNEGIQFCIEILKRAKDQDRQDIVQETQELQQKFETKVQKLKAKIRELADEAHKYILSELK